MASRKQNGRKKKSAVVTATGKKVDPASQAAAEQESREGYRERTEEGHRMLGFSDASGVARRRA